MGEKAGNGIRIAINTISGLFCALVLGALLFGDKRVDYPDWAKNSALLNNLVLAAAGAALLAGGMCVWRRWLSGRAVLQKILSSGFYPLLCTMTMALLLVQIFIARNLFFTVGWDVAIVTGTAEELWAGRGGIGRFFYYSQYPNNVGIVYVLTMVFRMGSWLGLEIDRYFVLILADCVLISLSGFVSALSVKRLTGNPKTGLLAFGLFAGLIGINPWMVVPYTDTYSILFPVLTFYFYLCAKKADKLWMEILMGGMAGLSGMAGYFVKPSGGLVLIAAAGYEALLLVTEKGRRRKAALLLGMFLAAFVISRGMRLHMLRATESDLDENMQFSYAHYLMMGLNEENTGAYWSEDYAFSGSQPDQKTRMRENLRIVKERINRYGAAGCSEFFLKKLLVNYNDGTFAWEKEGGFELSERSAAATPARQNIRRLLRSGTDWFGYYASFAQAVWVMVLCAVPLAGLAWKRDGFQRDGEYVIRISLIGSFLFVMLFEARARYLYNMAPMYVVCAAAGIWKLYLRGRNILCCMKQGK